MVASVGSPDSLAAILTTSSPSSSAKRHHSPARSYGALAFLNFFFHRVTRHGPKLLLYLALAIASLLVLTKCLPSSISNQIVSSTSHLWEFRPSGLGGSGGSKQKTLPLPGENNEHDSQAGGGLRVVVFGENDIATSIERDGNRANNGTSWTRELCIELGCTTYISNVPVLDSPRRSLSSNPLYGAAVDDALRNSKEKGPADDFTYVSEQYPIPWEAPDLYTQVVKFLEQPAPQRPPKETVWVFAPGMWDVWSLASFPRSTAESYLTSMVFDLFSTIEILYDAAHDSKSIAYSNYKTVPLDDEAILAAGNKTSGVKTPEEVKGKNSELRWEESASEPFRVVVPLLFDPSLVPGWHLDRPDAPALHTKPEQLQNAVRLTKRWNDYVMDEMNKWVKMNITFVHPDDRAAAAAAAAKAADEAAAAKAADIDKPNKPVPPPAAEKARVNPHANANNNAIKKADAKKTSGVPNISARDNNNRPPVPTLLRDGILFRMSDYIMDMIIDGQMRMRGIVDKKGFGKLPQKETFLEVDKPCVAPEFVLLPDVASKITTELHYEDPEEEKENKQKQKQDGNGNDDPTHTLVAPGPPTGTEKAVDDPTHTQVAPGPPTGTEKAAPLDDPTHTQVAPGPPTGTEKVAPLDDPTHTQVAPGPPTGTEKPPAQEHNHNPSIKGGKAKSRFRNKRDEDKAKAKKPVSPSTPAKPAKPATPAKLVVCEEPDTHLFFTPFSLGQRAIEDVGRLAASVVRASRTTRSAWEMDRLGSIENDRQPASWKEYYYS